MAVSLHQVLAAPADALPQARSKLQQARVLLGQGNIDAAEELVSEVEKLAVTFAHRDDSPRKVREAIAKARSDPKTLLEAARAAMKRGDLDRADYYAGLAEKVPPPSWLLPSNPWGDTPAKVRKDIKTARDALAAQPQPAPKVEDVRPPVGPKAEEHRLVPQPAADKGMFDSFKGLFGGGKKPEPAPVPKIEPRPDPTVTVDQNRKTADDPPKHPAESTKMVEATRVALNQNTERAKELLREANQAVRAKDFEKAKRLIEKAESLKPDLNWWEENTPVKLRAELARAAAMAQGSGITPNDNGQPAADKEEARAALKTGRELFVKGNLDEAAQMAQRARPLMLVGDCSTTRRTNYCKTSTRRA